MLRELALSYVLVRCHGDPPIARLQEALFAVARAGYGEVRFSANTAEMHLRPTLGLVENRPGHLPSPGARRAQHPVMCANIR